MPNPGGWNRKALELPTQPLEFRMTQNNRNAPKDISTFVPRDPSKAGGESRPLSFTGLKGNVVPWPVSEPKKIADQTITNVQIAMDDQAYAAELQDLLEKDNQHRAHIVDQPSPTMDGVVVVDAMALQRVGAMEETDALRYIVLHDESGDADKLWETGVRCVVPRTYSPRLIRTAILGMELRLKIEQSPR